MSAAEEARLRHLLRRVTGALNERSKQYEELHGALYESREELKTAQAKVDGLEWQVSELRELAVAYDDALRRLCDQSQFFGCRSCALGRGYDDDHCAIDELCESAAALGIEVER